MWTPCAPFPPQLLFPVVLGEGTRHVCLCAHLCPHLHIMLCTRLCECSCLPPSRLCPQRLHTESCLVLVAPYMLRSLRGSCWREIPKPGG